MVLLAAADGNFWRGKGREGKETLAGFYIADEVRRI